QRAANGNLRLVLVLDVHQLQVPDDFRLDFLVRKNLDYVDVQIAGDQVAQGLFVPALVHEVTQEDHDALATTFDAERPQGPFQVTGPGRFDLFQEVQQSPEAAPAADGREALRQPVVKGLDHDPVHVDQADKTQGGRHLLGIMQLGRGAEIH